MSALVLITGKLHGNLSTRPTRNGGAVTFFKLRVANGSTLEFWSAATFSDTVRGEIAELREGGGLSVVGQLTVEEWEDGDRRGLNRKVLVDRATALKQKPKDARPREAKHDADPKPRRGTTPIDPAAVARYAAPRSSEPALWRTGGEPNNDIPF